MPKFKQLVQRWQEFQVSPHGSTSTDVQVSNSHSTRSPSLLAISNNEQNSRMLDEFNAQDNSDSDSEPVEIRHRTPRSRLRRSSGRKPKMLRELEGHNESPEREIDSKHEERRHKRPLSKPKSSSRSSARRSQLLREIDDYNKPPEADDRHDLELARDLVDKPRLTREARRSLVCAAKSESPAPRQSLNLKELMRAQFKVTGQGTKRFQSEGNSNLSRYKKQRKDTTGLFLGEEEDDGEETLPNFSKTHDRGHSQSTPTRQLSPRQVEKVTGSSQSNDESSAESAWLPWDSRKGQSTP